MLKKLFGNKGKKTKIDREAMKPYNQRKEYLEKQEANKKKK